MITIFYSWQDDRKRSDCRYFVQDAIQEAIKSIGEIYGEIKLDQDTRDLPGTPPIVEEILKKINNADIFIGDISYVGEGQKENVPEGENSIKKLSNPNVLYESGYFESKCPAYRSIYVFNEDYGSKSELPFDLQHRRHPISYSLKDNKSQAKRDLTSMLAKAITAVIEKTGLLEDMASERKSTLETYIKTADDKRSTHLELVESKSSKFDKIKLLTPDGAGGFVGHPFLQLFVSPVEKLKIEVGLINDRSRIRTIETLSSNSSLGMNKYCVHDEQGHVSLLSTGEIYSLWLGYAYEKEEYFIVGGKHILRHILPAITNYIIFLLENGANGMFLVGLDLIMLNKAFTLADSPTWPGYGEPIVINEEKVSPESILLKLNRETFLSSSDKAKMVEVSRQCKSMFTQMWNAFGSKWIDSYRDDCVDLDLLLS